MSVSEKTRRIAGGVVWVLTSFQAALQQYPLSRRNLYDANDLQDKPGMEDRQRADKDQFMTSFLARNEDKQSNREFGYNDGVGMPPISTNKSRKTGPPSSFKPPSSGIRNPPSQ
jgi:hypothetical protein